VRELQRMREKKGEKRQPKSTLFTVHMPKAFSRQNRTRTNSIFIFRTSSRVCCTAYGLWKVKPAIQNFPGLSHQQCQI
jgi:hypothetical protein